VPSGVRAAQVVLVRASGSSATVRACRRTSGGYVVELGPFYGHVGRNGVSWSKREGDLKTPAGTFPLRGGFGARANPGLPQGWFRVDSNDVWVDDSGSSLYNTHQRKPVDGRWSSAENLLNTPAYNYAQVIGYNESRTPGKGSAIFFHVDSGGGTAGCVSLPTSALLAVMRWERVGAVMSIS
jgi:L,D-peptidoglycan transpeptidase YkuD (ErfK/YbiS/YcfS/YnhG family)